jgi:hypothetical protein
MRERRYVCREMKASCHALHFKELLRILYHDPDMLTRLEVKVGQNRSRTLFNIGVEDMMFEKVRRFGGLYLCKGWP